VTQPMTGHGHLDVHGQTDSEGQMDTRRGDGDLVQTAARVCVKTMVLCNKSKRLYTFRPILMLHRLAHKIFRGINFGQGRAGSGFNIAGSGRAGPILPNSKSGRAGPGRAGPKLYRSGPGPKNWVRAGLYTHDTQTDGRTPDQ